MSKSKVALNDGHIQEEEWSSVWQNYRPLRVMVEDKEEVKG